MPGVGVVHADERQSIQSPADAASVIYQQGRIGVGKKLSPGLFSLDRPIGVLMGAENRPDPEGSAERPQVSQEALNGCWIAAFREKIPSDDDETRFGFGQQRENSALSTSVLDDMKVREMRDHQAVKFRRQGLEPCFMSGDLEPIRLDDRDVDKEEKKEREDNKRAPDRSREPGPHERSNRPSCNSSARVKGIG